MTSARSVLYAAIISAAGVLGLARTTSVLDSSVPVIVQEKSVRRVIDFPEYNIVKIPPGNCTRYARMVAQELFGKEFPPGDAWDRKYLDGSFVVDGTLEGLAAKGTLQPGMLVGIYNPHTSRTEQKDREGKPAEFTHIGVYLGLSPNGEALIGEQYASKKIVGTEQELRNRGLVPKSVFDVKTPTADVVVPR